MIPPRGLLIFSGILLALPLAAALPARAASEQYSPPPGLLAGYQRQFKLDVALRMHVAVELAPRDRGLDAAALAAVDPTSPAHRTHLSETAFASRYGRSQADVDALVAWLHDNGATNVYAARNRLVVGADFTVRNAEHAFKTKYDLWQSGDRTIVAPTTPLTLPVGGIRAVRGAVKDFTPRLADVTERPGLPTDFRANWYDVTRFRQAYDAAPNGGAGTRIALIEDASDQSDPRDLAPFAKADSTLALDPSRVSERIVTPAVSEQVCGRDDRGQEPTMDVDAALTLAPAATLDVRYDEVCVRGGEGVVEIQRVLDDEPQPDVIVFPFAVAPLYGALADAFGPTPLPYLEAALRGIPVVVPSGDDGAYGIRVPGFEKPAVTYPCVLSVVICAGGSSLGERNGAFDEGPWNDGAHAGGGGISLEPRPSWQRAPMEYSLEHTVDRRMVPDLSADAGGHLLVYWHGYASGGVGGTSESAALIGAQLATIDAAVPTEHRLISAGDLYALATAHPEAFHDAVKANDRGYADNALHPRPQPLPLGFTGVVPSPPPQIRGCLPVRPRGCDVDKGYDLVTGLGSLRERAAIDALKASP
jgi:subtilase family serine protease